jgi:MFS family permease
VGLVTNYGQLLALRFCLGIFESGLFPGLNFFLTGWYRREEINRRAAIFFAGAVLAGAFGGIFGCESMSFHHFAIFILTSVALSKMGGVGGKAGWSWIVSRVCATRICAPSLTLVHLGGSSDPLRRHRFVLDGPRLA